MRRILFPTALLLLLVACDSPESADTEAAGDRSSPTSIVPAAASAVQESERARDVILVTLDTVRYDALSFAVASGQLRTEVPQLEKLVAEGRSFSFALAHNTITLPSHANILTGRYPFEHGVRENAAYTLPEDAPSVAKLLSAQGFATGAFVSAYVLDSRFGLADGFETYDDRIARDSKPSALRVWERRAPRTMAAALEWWRENADRRRFLWLHLFEPHLPYDPPEPFAAQHPDVPYRGEVAALDHFLADLFEKVRAETHRPFLIVTADHGEALGDHGEPAHGIFAYQATIHVPLILWGPGVVGGVDDRLARHIDILPTLLEAVGAPMPPELPGQSLLGPAAEGSTAEATSYFEALSATFDSGWAPLRGLVQGRLKVIDLPIPELYDLVADPFEEENVAEQRRRDFHRLRALLPQESSWPPARGELTDEAAARLRSLGYLSDDSSSIKASFGPQDDPKRWIHVEQLKQEYAEQIRDGRADKAVEAAEAILLEQPRMNLAFTMLAEAQLMAGDRRGAMATMRRAYEQETASPALIRRLISTLLREAQPRAALEVASRISGDVDPESRSLYGQVLRENGRVPEAKKILQAVLADVPDDALTLERLSAVALDLGRPGDAQAHAERALAIDP